ncbi:MAG: hypothetical protein ACI8SE_001528 [Bacteroidia bacterium]|jgi:hypothetical protein
MKSISTLLVVLVTTILTSCSGSTTYRGHWKATNPEGLKLDIFFDEKSFTVSDSSGQTKEYTYSQNAVNIENGRETYGILVKQSRTYEIRFPFADESKGFITDSNGNVFYTISRSEYITYDEANKLH